MKDFKEPLPYPENPPWTMFFDGPLYEKYKEFMATKDFSQILLTTKLKMANQSSDVPTVPGLDGGMGWWTPDQEVPDKPGNQFAGDEYNTVSDDFYRKFSRGKKEEKRRTRRTRAIILLIILVLLAVSLGTALIIHYFFVPTDEDLAPALVNISFSGNTSIFGMTTTEATMEDEDSTNSLIHELLDTIREDTHQPDPGAEEDAGLTSLPSDTSDSTPTTQKTVTPTQPFDPMDFFGMDENLTTTEGSISNNVRETTTSPATTITITESSTAAENGTIVSTVPTAPTAVSSTETATVGKPLVTAVSTVTTSSEQSSGMSTSTLSASTTDYMSTSTSLETTAHGNQTEDQWTTMGDLTTSVLTADDFGTTAGIVTATTVSSTSTESMTTSGKNETSTIDVYDTTTEDFFTEQTTVIEETTTMASAINQSTQTRMEQTTVPLDSNTTFSRTIGSMRTTSIALTTIPPSLSSTTAVFSTEPSVSTNESTTVAMSTTSTQNTTLDLVDLTTDMTVSSHSTSDTPTTETPTDPTSFSTQLITVAVTSTSTSETLTTTDTALNGTIVQPISTEPISDEITSTPFVSTAASALTTEALITTDVASNGTTDEVRPLNTGPVTVTEIVTMSSPTSFVSTTSPLTTGPLRSTNASTTSVPQTGISTTSTTASSNMTASSGTTVNTDLTTTIANTTIQTTTTPLPETTTEVLPLMTMEGSTTYKSEKAQIKCRVTDLGRFVSLSISEVKFFDVVKVTLNNNGSVRWTYSKTYRHHVTVEFTNITGSYLQEVTLSLWISDVECNDAGTFTCDLKTGTNEITKTEKLVVVGRPDSKIGLEIGPAIIEDRAVRITAIWQGGYPIPWTNMSWTALDSNNNTYNLADYGEYRDYELRVDHLQCRTFLESSIVIFPKIHLNDTTVIVQPDLVTTRPFLDQSMKAYLDTVEYGVEKILVIPLNYCQNGSKEVSVPHPYTACTKFVWCLPGDVVVQQCPIGTCFYQEWEECM